LIRSHVADSSRPPAHRHHRSGCAGAPQSRVLDGVGVWPAGDRNILRGEWKCWGFGALWTYEKVLASRS